VTPLHLVYDWLEELEGEELTAAPGTPASLTIVHKSKPSARASLAFQRSEPTPSSGPR
jgi:hypothetical protein